MYIYLQKNASVRKALLCEPDGTPYGDKDGSRLALIEGTRYPVPIDSETNVWGQVFTGDYNGLIAALSIAEQSLSDNAKRLLDDHVEECKRTDRLETTNTQLEVTNRTYEPVSIHAA